MTTQHFRVACGLIAVVIAAFGGGIAAERATHHDCVTTRTVWAYSPTEDSMPTYVNANYDRGRWTVDHCN